MSRSGSEGRFAERFHQRSKSTKETIEATDAATSVAEQLSVARSVIRTQEENIDELFTGSVQLVKSLDLFQQQSGKRQVNNIPLPTARILASPSLKLGYIKLTLQFFHAGMENFMEENLEISDELSQSRKTIKTISDYAGDVTIIGKIQDIVFDDDPELRSPIAETRTELSSEYSDDLVDIEPKTLPSRSLDKRSNSKIPPSKPKK